ncbi:energy-coupling factor ABC transporter ATP-binding protein [Dermacoccaceae bacterium W4C1]
MIEFTDVRHRFGERTVLDGITLALHESRVGLIGANGSGKSTLARTVNNLVQPEAGRVRVNGRDAATDTAQVRREVGFLFADPAAQILMPTVAEDIALSLRDLPGSAADKQDRLDRVLRRYGLAEHADHPAQLLSGGQQQLLAFAAVLVREPTVLVADEPSTLLDLANVTRLHQQLADLDQQVLLATHHLELLTDFDRVVMMDAGRVVADGAPGEVIAHYRAVMGRRS